MAKKAKKAKPKIKPDLMQRWVRNDNVERRKRDGWRATGETMGYEGELVLMEKKG